MEITRYISKGIHTINIFDHKYKLIGVTTTLPNGILKYNLYRSGIYNFICVEDPALSIINNTVSASPYSGRFRGIKG